jgi:hypothetical protein
LSMFPKPIAARSSLLICFPSLHYDRSQPLHNVRPIPS